MNEKEDKEFREKLLKILDNKGNQLDVAAQVLLKEINELMDLFPANQAFFGENLKYEKEKESRFFSRKSKIDLRQLREDVNSFADKNTVNNSRLEIQKLLRKHPSNPDINGLNAIQVFTDAFQSGLDAKKINVVLNCLKNMGKVLFNGGISLFNITWFIKIYLKYIELLSDKFRRYYSISAQHHHSKVREISTKLNQLYLQILVMQRLKDRLNSLALLNSRLKGSIYITEAITDQDIHQACVAVQYGNESKKLRNGKTAGHIIYIIITVCLILTKIPAMKRFILETMGKIHDTARDLILQKRMVLTNLQINDYHLAMAVGDEKTAVVLAEKLFSECQRDIKKYLEYAILTKQYEVDPFVKAAWIAKDSSQFYTRTNYIKNLKRARDLLDIVMGERCQFKGSYEAAKQLQTEILYILAQPSDNPY